VPETTEFCTFCGAHKPPRRGEGACARCLQEEVDRLRGEVARLQRPPHEMTNVPESSG